eukprot:g13707.t1
MQLRAVRKATADTIPVQDEAGNLHEEEQVGDAELASLVLTLLRRAVGIHCWPGARHAAARWLFEACAVGNTIDPAYRGRLDYDQTKKSMSKHGKRPAASRDPGSTAVFWGYGAACAKCKKGLHWHNENKTCRLLEGCGHLYHVHCMRELLEGDEANPRCCECDRPLAELGDIINIRDCFKKPRTTEMEARERRRERIRHVHCQCAQLEEQSKQMQSECVQLDEQYKAKEAKLKHARQQQQMKEGQVKKMEERVATAKKQAMETQALIPVLEYWNKALEEERAVGNNSAARMKLKVDGNGDGSGKGDAESALRKFFNWNLFNDCVAQGEGDMRVFAEYQEKELADLNKRVAGANREKEDVSDRLAQKMKELRLAKEKVKEKTETLARTRAEVVVLADKRRAELAREKENGFTNASGSPLAKRPKKSGGGSANAKNPMSSTPGGPSALNRNRSGSRTKLTPKRPIHRSGIRFGSAKSSRSQVGEELGGPSVGSSRKDERAAPGRTENSGGAGDEAEKDSLKSLPRTSLFSMEDVVDEMHGDKLQALKEPG